MTDLAKIPDTFDHYVQTSIAEDDREHNLQEELKNRREESHCITRDDREHPPRAHEIRQSHAIIP